ncbi:S-layer homology domain-containing protein [Cytobacillus sp. FJAT-53684]|uniref:S-layer homology domain-containing protein n=1 Tax=Cytobacillus mangrovibacter TaxID=3299024 RepID=A0ABW6K0B7_9BACI
MKKLGFLVIVASIVSSLLFGLTIQAATFKDIPNNFWAKSEIDYLFGKNIISGYPNGNFGPNDNVKRIDAAAMVVKALNLNTTNRPNPQFKDISRSTVGFDVIATVVDEGIFTGTDGSFYPNKTLTRAEMAAIINRAFKLEKKSTKVTFKDVNSKFWGYLDIQNLVGHKITEGFPNNTFQPSNPTTRAQFSVFLTRALKGKEGNTGTPDKDSFEVIGIY